MKTVFVYCNSFALEKQTCFVHLYLVEISYALDEISPFSVV